MSLPDCHKENCPECSTGEFTADPHCPVCHGNGFIFFIGEKRVSKEEFREFYNASVMYNDEHLTDDEHDESDQDQHDADAKGPIGQITELQEKLIEKFSLPSENKDTLTSPGPDNIHFIACNNSTIHVNSIVKVTFSDSAESGFLLTVHTRDNCSYSVQYTDRDECLQKYREVQKVLQVNEGLLSL